MSTGLSAIAGRLHPIDRHEPGAVVVHMGPHGRTIRVPIVPGGSHQDVAVQSVDVLPEGGCLRVRRTWRARLRRRARAGAREADVVTVTVRTDGPLVIDVARALQCAVKRRCSMFRPCSTYLPGRLTMAIEVPMPKLGLTMEEATDHRVARRRRRSRRSGPADPPDRDRQDRDRGRRAGSGRLHQIGEPGDVFPCGELDRPAARRGRDAAGTGADRSTSTGDRAGKCRCPVSGRAGTGCRERSGDPGGRPAVRLAECAADRRRTRRRRCARCAAPGPGGRIVSEDVRRRPGRHRPPRPGRLRARGGDGRRPQPRRPARRRPRRPCPSTRSSAASPATASPRTCASSSATRARAHPPRARPRRLRRRQRHRRRRFSRSCRSRPRRSGCRGCAARSPSACTPRCRRWRS